MEKEKLTYGKKIEEMKKLINSIYDDAEYLRDIATDDEKVHWNNLRGLFYDADKPLRSMLNKMSENRFNMEI